MDSSPEVAKAVIDAPFSHKLACGLRKLLVGEDPMDTERLWDKMYRGCIYFGRRGVAITAMAGMVACRVERVIFRFLGLRKSARTSPRANGDTSLLSDQVVTHFFQCQNFGSVSHWKCV